MQTFLRSFSKLISIIVHPLMMPVYCTLYTLYGPTFYSCIPNSVKTAMLMNVGIYACLSPLIVLGIFIRVGLVTDMEMPSRRERSLPLLVISLVTCLGSYLMGARLAGTPIGNMVLGEGLLLLIAGFISLFWKISLHAIGAGGLLAYVVVTGIMMHIDFSLAAAWAFIVSGLAAWARLYEDAHTPGQMLVGFITGFVVMFITLKGLVAA